MSRQFCAKASIYRQLDDRLKPLAVKLRLRVNGEHLFEFILTKTKDYLADLLFLCENLDEIYQLS